MVCAVQSLTPRSVRRGRALWREWLVYGGYRCAEGVVRLISHRQAYALAAWAANITMWCMPRKTDGLVANLRRVLPDADDVTIRRIAHQNFRNHLRGWVDVMEMRWRPDELTSRLVLTGREYLDRAVANGKGAVLVSIHFGAWEAGIASWNGWGEQMSLLAERMRPHRLFDRIVGARTSLGVDVIPIDVEVMQSGDAEAARHAGAAAMREVMRRIRSNRLVAMAIDRDVIGNGVPTPFFGANAPIPLGVIDIAMRAGAPILLVTLTREGDKIHGRCHGEVSYDAAAPRDEELARVAAHLLPVFEDIIRRHPDQWHVLDPLWNHA